MGKLLPALKEKCPRCAQGDLYVHPQRLPFSKKPFLMKKYCEHCGLKYEKEVGFFYGSMYFSYALNVGLFLICLVAYSYLFKDQYGWGYFAVAYLSLTFLLTGVIFRWSRALWLAAIVRYHPETIDYKNLELIRDQPNVGR